MWPGAPVGCGKPVQGPRSRRGGGFMLRIQRLVLSVLTAVTLLVLLASPVWATVWDSGYKTCTIHQTQKVTSYSTGFTEHWPGPSGYHAWTNGSWIVRVGMADAAAGGGWTVGVTNGSLDDPGTYATCVNGTP
jgi:hypothetical protein